MREKEIFREATPIHAASGLPVSFEDAPPRILIIDNGANDTRLSVNQLHKMSASERMSSHLPGVRAAQTFGPIIPRAVRFNRWQSGLLAH